MITDGEFSALIAEAAETIPEPTGADAILAAARVEIDSPSVASPIAKARRHPRGFAISALGAAAVLAILIAVAARVGASHFVAFWPVQKAIEGDFRNDVQLSATLRDGFVGSNVGFLAVGDEGRPMLWTVCLAHVHHFKAKKLLPRPGSPRTVSHLHQVDSRVLR
jgi:hypothetical protein